MRIRKCITSIYIVASLFLCLFVNPVEARADEYTYTVKIHLADSDLDGDGLGDARALFNTEKVNSSVTFVNSNQKEKLAIEGDTLVVSNISYGTVVYFDKDQAISVTPDETGYSKYFVKGIRLSGRDDSDKTASLSAFTVTKDLDYVVVYSVGQIVPYTVRYLDDKGNKLFEDQLFYGPLNESISVSSRYISGYIPNTYNYFIKKLSGPDENGEYFAVDFIYTKGGPNTYITDTVYENGGIKYVYQDGGPEYVYVNADGAAAGNANAAANANADGDGDNAQIADEAVPEAGPAEVIEIGEEETPLHGMIKENAFPLALIVIIIIGVLALLAFVLLIYWKKKKSKKKDNKETDKKE